MLDLLGMIATLERPRLLVSAARFGVADYDRAKHLPRLIGAPASPRPGEAIMKLIDLETMLESKRRAKSADYTHAQHVSVMIALLGESRALRAANRPAAVAA